jgi:hypothetical protein
VQEERKRSPRNATSHPKTDLSGDDFACNDDTSTRKKKTTPAKRKVLNHRQKPNPKKAAAKPPLSKHSNRKGFDS